MKSRSKYDSRRWMTRGLVLNQSVEGQTARMLRYLPPRIQWAPAIRAKAWSGCKDDRGRQLSMDAQALSGSLL